MSANENRTPPLVDSTSTSSDTARTAAKPTPNRPTTPVCAGPASGRLADARIEERDATPAASSGAPVLAATSTAVPSSAWSSRSSSRPGTPARVAASAAFCARLDDDAVAVVAAGVVLLGVGVLPQTGR